MRNQPAREIVDIEALFVRAYREKRIDRLPHSVSKMLGVRGPASIGNNLLSRGQRVDTSGFGANTAAHINETRSAFLQAGELMLAAHDLVLSLDDYFIEDLYTDDCKFILWTKDGALEAGQWIAISDREATIQAAIVTRDWGADGGNVTVKPVAGTRRRRLHRLVMAPIIVIAGRSGEPPGVSPIEIETTRKIYAAKSRKVIGEEPVYVTPLREVVRERGEYAAWHHALTAVAARLSEVTGQTLVGPKAPDRPWEDSSRAIAA